LVVDRRVGRRELLAVDDLDRSLKLSSSVSLAKNSYSASSLPRWTRRM